MSRPLISFDAAGTLIQVCEPVGQTYAVFAHQHGVAVAAGALKAAFGQLWGRVPVPQWPEGHCAPDDERSWWRRLVAEVFAHALGQPVQEEVMDRLFEDLYHHFSLPEAWIVYHDVRPALENLVQDHRLCVLSNFDKRLRGVLAGHGLADYFVHTILSSEVGAAKPHPRMFATAVRLMDATDAPVLWHVGDDEVCDVQGATLAGWNAFKVSRPDQDLLKFVEKVRLKGKSHLRP